MYPAPARVYIVDYSWSNIGIIGLWAAASKVILSRDYPFFQLVRSWSK